MDKETVVSFDALFSNASMGIIIADEQGKIVLANPFLLKQFDYMEEELVGQPIEKLIPKRFHERHTNHVHHYNRHPKSRPMGQGMDLFAIRRDGSEFPVEVSLGSYQSKQGKYVIAFLSDISLRKEAEQALITLNAELESKIEERTLSLTSTVHQLAKQVEETRVKDFELNRVNAFLKNIWDHAEAIIFVTDPNGILQMFNPSAERHLGYRAEEVIYTKKPEIFYYNTNHSEGKAQDSLFSISAAKAENGTSDEGETFFVRKDGSHFPVSYTLTVMRGKDGSVDGYLGIALDISERKKAETDLRLALEKEKELSELKSRFVSLASHEFRTPLSTVLSSAYLISKYTDAEDHPKREKHVQRIVSSVNMLTDILNDFLSVGKIEEGKIQIRYSEFDIVQHMTNIVSELNGLLKQGQSIRFEHKGGTVAKLDPALLKHIILNLLSNAIKFSPENTTIDLRLNVSPGSIQLKVKDKGLGISEEDQQHLFERFFRGTNVTNIQGTGLGLHIVSKYAELMHGTVQCNSKLGEGTVFIITFNNLRSI